MKHCYIEDGFDGIVIYSDIKTHETYIESWGASTKHPDIMRKVEKGQFSDDITLYDIAQALLSLGADMLFPFHIRKFVDTAQIVLDCADNC